MSVAIRLSRRGKKSQPHFNIIVQDKEKHPRGGVIEKIGYYKSYTNPITVEIDLVSYDKWISQGAQPSARVGKLAELKRSGKIAMKDTKHKKFAGKFVEIKEKAADKAAPAAAPDVAPDASEAPAPAETAASEAPEAESVS